MTHIKKKRGRPVISDDTLPLSAIVADYHSGLSLMDIGGKYGVSDMTIYNRLKKSGIPTRPRYRQENRMVRTRLKPSDVKDFSEKIAMFLYEGRNAYDMSVHTGVSIKDVLMEIKRQCAQSSQTPSDQHTTQ